MAGRQDTGSHQQSNARGSKLSEQEFFSAFSSPHFSEVGRVEHRAHFWNSLSQVVAQIEVDRAMLGGRNSSSQETQ